MQKKQLLLFTKCISLVLLGIMLSSCIRKPKDTLWIYLDKEFAIEQSSVEAFINRRESEGLKKINIEFIPYDIKHRIRQGFVPSKDGEKTRIKRRAKRILKKIDVYIGLNNQLMNLFEQEGLLLDYKNLTPPLDGINKIKPSIAQDSNYRITLSYRPMVMVFNSGLPENASLANINSYDDFIETDRKLLVPEPSKSPYLRNFLAFMIFENIKRAAKICGDTSDVPSTCAKNLGITNTSAWIEEVDSKLAFHPSGDEARQVRYIDGNLGDFALIDLNTVNRMIYRSDVDDRIIGNRLAILLVETMFYMHTSLVMFKDSNQLAASQNFVKFLLSDDGQFLISSDNFDYPAIEGARQSYALNAWGQASPIQWETLQSYMQYLPEADKLITQVNW